ncbi:dnaJ homolog subfamily C member 28-like [Ornithodoros turicata]|uniref:dnaJ homolog subfamily C member 28-like n=1 Tax=Ornithodoros turicata TaxID=34597 RepID=UPI00313A0431
MLSSYFSFGILKSFSVELNAHSTSVKWRPFSLGRRCLVKTDREIDKDVKESYCLLGVSEDCNLQEVKDAFLKLAMKYHPDRGGTAADAAKFDEIKKAYHTVRAYLSKDTSDDVDQVIEKDFNIKHTVPQHRQYLNLEGVGYGTPTQRQKQYDRYRVAQAADRVFEYRARKAKLGEKNTLVQHNATLAHQYKTTNAIERLVEDLIQESIAKGEFDNLPGFGKPLKFAPENPFVDSMTQKLNQVLINNGFVPEWVMLEKEINEEKQEVRNTLSIERAKLGPLPLDSDEKKRWDCVLENLRKPVANINHKINKYNMVVPLPSKQQLHFQLAQVSEKVLKTPGGGKRQTKASTQKSTTHDDKGLLAFLLEKIKP